MSAELIINNLNTIITVAIFVIIGLFAVWGVIWGLIRGTMRSISRLITIVLSAALAFIIVSIVGGNLVPLIETFVRDTLMSFLGGIPQVAEILEASPDLVAYVLEVITALLTPILFSVLFGVFAGLSWIVYFLISLTFPKKSENPLKGYSRVIGMVISVITFVLVALCLLMPVTGYLAYGTETYASVKETGLIPAGAVPANVETQIDAGRNNIAIKTVNFCGGNLLFSMTSKVGNSSATAEVDYLIAATKDILPAVKQLMDDNAAVADGGEILNLDALNNIILPAIDKSSPRLRTILVDVVKVGAEKLKNGETFLGLNTEALLGEYSESADALLERLSKTNIDKFTADVRDFGDSMELLSRTYVYFVSVTDKEQDMDTLKNNISGILHDITPDTAGILKDVISSDIIGSANIANESASTILGMVGETLTQVAEMKPEDKAKEAEAINLIISYASSARSGDVNEDEMIGTLLGSNVLSQKVTGIAATNKADGTAEEDKSYIHVTASQKAKLDTIIDEKINTEDLSVEDTNTLIALKQIIVVKGLTDGESGGIDGE